jgi:hypothetical protein
MSHPYLVQSDPRWKECKLGLGSSTFWGGGCLLLALTEIAADLGTIQHRDPRQTNQLGIDNGCFVGSDLKIPEMAAALGLKAGPKIDLDVVMMGRMLAGYLESGRQAVVFVDHDRTLPNGDVGGEHFLRAFRLSTEGIVCSDAAVGEATVLDVETLRGAAQWGRQPFFQGVAFRTLSRA